MSSPVKNVGDLIKHLKAHDEHADLLVLLTDDEGKETKPMRIIGFAVHPQDKMLVLLVGDEDTPCPCEECTTTTFTL